MGIAIPFIQIFIVLQCLLVLLFLSANKRFNLLSNRILGAFIILLSTHMLLNLARQHLQLPAPNLGIGLGFCYGPVIYLYARSLTYGDFRVGANHLYHLVPPFLMQISVFFAGFQTSFYAIGIFCSLAIYNLLIWKVLRHYRYVLSQTRSDFEQITLHWLSYLFFLQLILLGLNIISEYLHSSGFEDAGMFAKFSLFAGLWVLVTLIIFQGMQHPLLFTGLTKEDSQIVSQPSQANRVSKALLEEVFEKINIHMEKEKPYLNSNLTVKTLGQQMTLVPRQVSQAINLKADKNFSEYVNEFRIKHACQLLSSAQARNISIMDVMLDSGFITKSNFNRAFKKVTGITPFEFKENSQI